VSSDNRIEEAANIAAKYGEIDGAHHKQWVIDQMLRSLLGADYPAWVQKQNSDPEYDSWDVGIAP